MLANPRTGVDFMQDKESTPAIEPESVYNTAQQRVPDIAISDQGHANPLDPFEE